MRRFIVILAACGNTPHASPDAPAEADAPDATAAIDGSPDATACSGWTAETVATTFTSGARLAIDGASTYHVVYADETAHVVRHASRDATAQAWTTETIGDTIGGNVVLERDAAGTLHVAHHNQSGTGLVYARLDPGGTWVSTPTPEDGACPIAVGVDGSGLVHVMCAAGGLDDYALDGTGTGRDAWTTTIAAPTMFGQIIDPLMGSVIDPAGGLGVAYALVTQSGNKPAEVHFAHMPAGGAWTDEIVEGNWSEGDVALALSAGTPIAAYDVLALSDDKFVLTIATRGATSWASEDTPVRSRNEPLAKAMLVEPDGTIDIAYYDFDAMTIALARRAPDGAWTTETVVSAGSYGNETVHPTSLALDPTGHLVILYYDANVTALVLARRC